VRARCHDEDVVGEHRPIVEEHFVAFDPDSLDCALVEHHVSMELALPRAHDLVDVRQPERHEEETRLVDVRVVTVDDVNVGLVWIEAAP
jgi:hypothetical protein